MTKDERAKEVHLAYQLHAFAQAALAATGPFRQAILGEYHELLEAERADYVLAAKHIIAMVVADEKPGAWGGNVDAFMARTGLVLKTRGTDARWPT